MKITINSVKLVKESSSNYEVTNDVVKSPREVVKLINDIFQLEDEAVENLVCLFFNTKNKIVGCSTLSKGTITEALVSPREILQQTLLHNATSIIIAHNHPSGDPYPSKEDIQVTKRVQDACKIMGVKLLDHVIIGDNAYVSLNDQGYMG